jgi:hypothetical protein
MSTLVLMGPISFEARGSAAHRLRIAFELIQPASIAGVHACACLCSEGRQHAEAQLGCCPELPLSS